MKKNGCTMEFADDRCREVREAFNRAFRAADGASVAQMAEMAVREPASRFWVSEERAYNVVSRLLRGQPALQTMRGPKRRMYEEIYRRVLKLRASRPGATLVSLIAEVVYQPAPEHYMRAATAVYLINKAKRERRRGYGRG